MAFFLSLSTLLSPLRVLLAGVNPRGHVLAKPEKLGFLWRSGGDYKPSSKKARLWRVCLGWAGVSRAELGTKARTRVGHMKHLESKIEGGAHSGSCMSLAHVAALLPTPAA